MAYCDIETPLPPDILFFHILPRLPGKSVHRFLCVCKQWQSFLTTPVFAKMHRHHRHKLLIALSTTLPRKFSIIDLEAAQIGPIANRPLPFEVKHRVAPIVCVRGLVCLRMINKCNMGTYSDDIILWNPLTSEHKTVSRPNTEECYATSSKLLGFCYSYNDYKILLVTEDHNVYIYSLKSDSWRKVETTEEDLSLLRHHLIHHYGWSRPCVSLDEKMCLEAIEVNDKAMGNLIIIISFDMKTEKWRKMVGPNVGNGFITVDLSSMIVRGCIHLHVKYRHETDIDGDYHFVTELWRMDGDGDWTKVANTASGRYFSPWHSLYPLHLMNNGNWVMQEAHIKELYEADLETHTKKWVYAYDRHDIFISKRGIYTETLGINMFN